MNEFDTIEAAMEQMALADEPMPERVHGKIMKRVFLAGYGKYLAFSGAILLLNLGVLSLDLYRAFMNGEVMKALQGLRESFSFSPSYLASALGTLYGVLPVSSIIATAFTLGLTVYIANVFVKVYRNPHGVKILRS